MKVAYDSCSYTRLVFNLLRDSTVDFSLTMEYEYDVSVGDILFKEVA